MVVPRGVLKDEGVGEEEGGQLEVFALSIQKNGSGRHVIFFGRSSISMRARLFRCGESYTFCWWKCVSEKSDWMMISCYAQLSCYTFPAHATQ